MTGPLSIEPGQAPLSTRLATCLAEGDPSAGRPAAPALQACLEALDLARRLDRPFEARRAEAWACQQLLRLGRHVEMLGRARVLLPQLTAPELARDRRELLRAVAASGSETGAFDVAIDAAQELARGSHASGDPAEALTAAFALAVCLERMGDSWQAVRLLRQALEAHGEREPCMAQLIAANAACSVCIGMLHRLRGATPEDEQADTLHQGLAYGRRALALLDAVPDPVYEVTVKGNLGELLLHAGDLAGSEALLRQALEFGGQRGLRAHQWRIRTSLADWLLASGRAAESLDAARTLLAEMADDAPVQTAIRAHDSAYRAARSLGRFDDALAHFEQAERLERRRTTAQLRGQSQLFVTRSEAQRAESDALRHRRRAAEFAAEAERDPLTGLGNRRHLAARCAALLPIAEREGRPLVVAEIDIDHFKTINDRFGHSAGDRVLVALAQLLRDGTRADDVLVRHGGEEFVVVLPDLTLARAHEICERLRDRVERHVWPGFASGGPLPLVTISVGLAAAPRHDLTELLARADQALYEAKRLGRNRVERAA